jgi:hypothetical protein
MHDFDVERAKRHAERAAEFGDKPFKFAGEVFHVRPNIGYLGIKRVAELTDASTGTETFDAIEASVISMLDPRDDAIGRFLAVSRNLDDPVTFEDLVELQNWLVEQSTNRPPTQEEPSASMPPQTGNGSTEVSSTVQGEASTT